MTERRGPAGTASEFDRTTALEGTGLPGEFEVTLDPGWSSLVGVHGGYLCAIAVRGAETLAPDRAVRTLTTSFLRTASPGPATLTVQAVRQGRTMSTLTAELRQDGRLLTTTRLTLLVPRDGVDWGTPVRLELAPPEDCVRVDPGQVRVAHFDQADGLLDPVSLPFSGGDRAVVRGHLRPLSGRHVDSSWLAMASDWFPPPAFVRIEPPTGGISIDLTTHIHRPELTLGAGQWLSGAFEVENSSGGLAVEHGVLAAPDGALVAESFQTRLMARG